MSFTTSASHWTTSCDFRFLQYTSLVLISKLSLLACFTFSVNLIDDNEAFFLPNRTVSPTMEQFKDLFAHFDIDGNAEIASDRHFSSYFRPIPVEDSVAGAVYYRGEKT